jgi:hypothetical protein
MLITLTLVIDELTNAGQRRWWTARPLTTDTVAGLLVLLVTILVVNQLLNRRQARQRGHAVAEQAAIMVAQATRSAKAASSLINGSGETRCGSSRMPRHRFFSCSIPRCAIPSRASAGPPKSRPRWRRWALIAASTCSAQPRDPAVH